MRSIMGLELRNVSISPGIAHDMLQAELWLHKSKIGEIYDDGWIDELYVEFIDEEAQKAFTERVMRYNKNKHLDLNATENLIKHLLFISRSYRSVQDKCVAGCAQITFI